MLWEHELTGQCFQSFFKFSETSMSVSKTRKKYGEHVLFLLENNLKKKKNTTCLLLLSKCKFSSLTPSRLQSDQCMHYL